MTARRRSTVKRLTAIGLGLLAYVVASDASADDLDPIRNDADPLETIVVAPIGPGLDRGTEGVVPEEGTPLALRQDSAPLAPSDEGQADLDYGLGALAVMLLGAFGFVGYRRLKAGAPASPTPTCRVLSRTALSARSSVVLLEVEGQRLLVGVTPGGMTRLEAWRVGDAEIVDPRQAELDEELALLGPVEAETEDDLACDDLAAELPMPDSQPRNRPPRRDVTEDREDFRRALGEVERRLARYQAGAAPDVTPADAPAPEPRLAVAGGQQARSLLRLEKTG